MRNVIPLSIRFSIIDVDNTEAAMFFVAAINVAVSTEVPVTPADPPYTKIVITEAETVLTNVHASHVRTAPQTFLKNPAFTIHPVTTAHIILTME